MSRRDSIQDAAIEQTHAESLDSSQESALVLVSEKIAEVLKVIAHPARVRMLLKLFEQDRTVAWLAADNAIPPHAASGHLRLMQRSGVVKGVRHGKFVLYRISDGRIKQLMQTVSQWKS